MSDDDDKPTSGGEHPSEPLEKRTDPSTRRPRIVDSDLIFAGHREVWIRHGDDMYRLRMTRLGKLYLSK